MEPQFIIHVEVEERLNAVLTILQKHIQTFLNYIMTNTWRYLAELTLIKGVGKKQSKIEVRKQS